MRKMRRTRHVAVFVAAMQILVWAASTASAQGVAHSFEQLQVLTSPGDRIELTDRAGLELSGTIGELTSSTLTLLVDGRPRLFQQREVARIQQRRSDSLVNGALWGFGVGAALGAAAVLTDRGIHEGRAGWVLFIGGLWGGLGAGAGLGIDALTKSHGVIYESPPESSVKARIGAAAWANRAGVLLAFPF